MIPRRAAALLLAACALVAAAPAGASGIPVEPATRHWAAQGGELRIRFNHDLLRQFGLHLELPGTADVHGAVPYPLRDDALAFSARWGTIRAFGKGALTTRAGFVLRRPGGEARVDWLALEAGAADPPTLAVRDARGRTWFTAERMMYRLDEAAGRLRMPTVDLRIGPALAAFLGDADAAGLVVGDLVLDAGLVSRSAAPSAPKTCAAPEWHGSNGKTTDVVLQAMSVQQLRCRRSTSREIPVVPCDGPGGADDGEVVIAPSALLRNSDTPQAADVPWYEKFLQGGPFPPYGNDQHPILVWNLYRIGDDGRIRQIGRSGAKHAWFSTNFGCTDDSCSGGHVLGRGCADEYTAGSNDLEYYLAPRSEIVPARGLWGRCGSTWDRLGPGGAPGCDGQQDEYVPQPPAGRNFYQRLVARESDLEAPPGSGTRWWFEAWYVVRDDIDVFNTMGHVGIMPAWVVPPFGTGYWRMDALPPASGGFRNGPAIDAWVAPGATGNARSETLVTPEGTLRVAVRATPVGARWRYDYAVMNLDFARAVTEGAEPDLRVLDARGIGAFSVPVVAGGAVSALQSFDLDGDPGNDWTTTATVDRVVFNAPPTDNSLDWGTLFAFSFESAAAPVAGAVSLAAARAGQPAFYEVPSLVPGVPPLFADGFE